MPKGNPAGYLPNAKKSKSKPKAAGLRGRNVMPAEKFRL
jgi:hypothetical protein